MRDEGVPFSRTRVLLIVLLISGGVCKEHRTDSGY